MATIDTRAECIAQACGYANDAGLPNTYALTRQLAELVAMLQAIDRGHFNGSGMVADDPRVTRAARMVAELRPFIGANI